MRHDYRFHLAGGIIAVGFLAIIDISSMNKVTWFIAETILKLRKRDLVIPNVSSPKRRRYQISTIMETF